MRILIVGVVLHVACLIPALSVPLTVVNVAAPEINCIFESSCRVTVTDTIDTVSLEGAANSGFLQSRTFQGSAGAPASGFHAYEYRLDLRNLVGYVDRPCVRELRFRAGPLVTSLDYDSDGSTGEHLYVVTSGGLGSVGPIAVEATSGELRISFAGGLCAGGSPGGGVSSFFIGFTSPRPPRFVPAVLTDNVGIEYPLEVRAPSNPFLVAVEDLINWIQVLPIESILGPSREVREARRAQIIGDLEQVHDLVSVGEIERASKALDRYIEKGSPLEEWIVDDPATLADEKAETSQALEALVKEAKSFVTQE